MRSQLLRAVTTRASTRATEQILIADEQEWEGVLEEMESEKLYGLGSKAVELEQFVAWLEKGKLNLFPGPTKPLDSLPQLCATATIQPWCCTKTRRVTTMWWTASSASRASWASS